MASLLTDQINVLYGTSQVWPNIHMYLYTQAGTTSFWAHPSLTGLGAAAPPPPPATPPCPRLAVTRAHHVVVGEIQNAYAQSPLVTSKQRGRHLTGGTLSWSSDWKKRWDSPILSSIDLPGRGKQTSTECKDNRTQVFSSLTASWKKKRDTVSPRSVMSSVGMFEPRHALSMKPMCDVYIGLICQWWLKCVCVSWFVGEIP